MAKQNPFFPYQVKAPRDSLKVHVVKGDMDTTRLFTYSSEAEMSFDSRGREKRTSVLMPRSLLPFRLSLSLSFAFGFINVYIY